MAARTVIMVASHVVEPEIRAKSGIDIWRHRHEWKSKIDIWRHIMATRQPLQLTLCRWHICPKYNVWRDPNSERDQFWDFINVRMCILWSSAHARLYSSWHCSGGGCYEWERDGGSPPLTHFGSTKRQLPANHSLFHLYLETRTLFGELGIMQNACSTADIYFTIIAMLSIRMPSKNNFCFSQCKNIYSKSQYHCFKEYTNFRQLMSVTIVRHWSHRHWSHQTLITPCVK